METAARPPLRRLLEIDRVIRAGEYPNATTLAERLEVHPRTVHRDLDFLRCSWGAPLEFCRLRNGFYYRDPDYALPLMRLTEGELVALFLAERAMQRYKGTPFAQDLATAFRKLTARLPDTVTVNLDHLREGYSFRGPEPGGADPRMFRQLERAVREGRQLELVYWSASRDEVCRRVVDPYHLTSVQGEWYLIAYCHLREEVRMFAPSRVRSLKETGARFARPADFSIDAYLDASFRVLRGGEAQEVRLRFTPAVARYVRGKVWHPSQELREGKGGTLEVTFRLGHLLEVKRWVLSWGADCEVLAPEELRREVAEELGRARTKYV
ncbi:MAG TPA: transcriptional regulator [Gemmataceae bacterium]